MIPIKDINLSKAKTPNDIIKQMYAAGGFSAKKIAVGVDILELMTKDKDCTRILSMPGAPISTGLRGVICDLVKNKLIDIIITTCGFLDHDFARIWKPYMHGDFMMDDAALHKKGIFRLGNILIPKSSYGEILEDKLQPLLQKLWSEGKQELASYEIIAEMGKSLENENPSRIRSAGPSETKFRLGNKNDSIIYWAYKNKIPIFVPGLTDGAVGNQIWLFSQKKKFRINTLEDENKIASMMFDAKKLGALSIGGGISKHHAIWWAQFRGGLDYMVYITTAVEWDGSLSGAQTREAISWGKLKEKAKHITIEGDATALLPLMIAALLERL